MSTTVNGSPTAAPGNQLHVAQYVALRNEIRGYQQDEATLITTSLAAVGTIVTVAAWQQVILLLVLVPMFLYVTWRKVTALTANTFRTASFIKAYYEQPADIDAMCWEHAIEVWRVKRSDIEQKLSWRGANAVAMRMFMLIAVVAALALVAKAWGETDALRAAQVGQYDASIRAVYAIKADGVTVTSRDLDDLKREADRADRAFRSSAARRMWMQAGSAVAVLVAVVWGLVMTRGRPGSVGETQWRGDADSRMKRVRSGELKLRDVPATGAPGDHAPPAAGT
jgi:hypothetical protein